MAVSKSNKKKQQCYISVPSQIINSISSSSLESLLISPKKKPPPSLSRFRILLKNPRFFLFLLFVFGFLGMLKMWFNFDPFLTPSNNPPCGAAISQPKSIITNGFSASSQFSLMAATQEKFDAHSVNNKGDDRVETMEFWKQPDGMGYKPCLQFSRDYVRTSPSIVKDRTKYLMVVVAGGMNQQRNQIVDAVVIARILGATLVVPILQVNVIWGDERFLLFLHDNNCFFIFFPFFPPFLICINSVFQLYFWPPLFLQ